MKLAYFTGPGNVVGTYRHWREGRGDPGVPVRPYSSMFYDLVEQMRGEALVLHTFPGEADLQEGRFRIERLQGAEPAAGRIGYQLQRYRLARAIATRINAFKPDAAVISSGAPIPLLSMLDSGFPTITSIHRTYWPMHQPPADLKPRIKLALLRRALSHTDAAIGTSAECGRQYLELRGKDVPVQVQRPVLNYEAPLKPQTETPGARHFVYVGRITYDKGVFLLLKAFERLTAEQPGSKLSFAGDGEALEPLRSRVAQSPCDAQVEVLGRLPAAEVLDLMTRADLLVCPTLTEFTEGLAMVCIEAAAVGTPTLMSSVVPAQDILAGSCLTFQADSEEALLQAMRRLSGDSVEYRRMVAATRTLAPAFRDPSDCWGEQLRRLLDALL